MSASRHKQIDSVQYLRAIAALLVTVAHASEEAKYFFKFKPIFETDAFGKGVDLFFVISGFIIYFASQSILGQKRAPGTFITNRAIRVIPMYYLATTLMVFTIIALPGGVKEAIFDKSQVITSYLFIPYERYDGRIAPTLSLGWTLNYEIFFYALFSACLYLPRNLVATSAISLLLILSILGIFVPDNWPAAFRAWTDSIIIEFAFGMLIAVFFLNVGKRYENGLFAAILIIGGLLLLYFLNTPPKPLHIPRFVSAGVPAAIIVVGAVIFFPQRLEQKLPRFGVALGNSSYSLYLSHRFIQRPVQILVNKGLGQEGLPLGGIYVFLAVFAAVAFGHIVYVFVETPLLKFLRKKFLTSKGD